MEHKNVNDRLDRVESTIQFILDLQAQAESRRIEYQAASEVRRAEADREIKQIRRVLLAAIQSGRRERTKLDEKFKMLAESQMRTDAKMQIFLDSLRKGNGSSQ